MTNKETPADLARTVRVNAYTYLGNFPNRLTNCPPGSERFVAELVLDVGKYLKWISGHVDLPDDFAPWEHDELKTLKQLADDILAVAVVLHGNKPVVTHRQRTMQLALDSLTSQLTQLRKEFDYEQAS